MSKIKVLTDKIERLKGELKILGDSLPAHSVRPHQLMRIEEIEEEIEMMEDELKRLKREAKYL